MHYTSRGHRIASWTTHAAEMGGWTDEVGEEGEELAGVEARCAPLALPLPSTSLDRPRRDMARRDMA
eukprot:1146917-Rhodomonas_salina.3